MTAACIACDIGWYKPLAENAMCTECPFDMTTASTATVDLSGCGESPSATEPGAWNLNMGRSRVWSQWRGRWNEMRRHSLFLIRVFGHFRWEPEMARHVSPHFALCTQRLFTPCLAISSQLKWPDTCVSSSGMFGHFNVENLPRVKQVSARSCLHSPCASSKGVTILVFFCYRCSLKLTV